MLHAEHLVVSHPVTGKVLDLRAPLPKDFDKMLKALRKLDKPAASTIKRGLRSPLNPK
jgi:23S rRNA pseudouridine1911/1915/1917 synthase